VEILKILSQASIVGLLSMFVGVIPLGVGVAYALRPSEHRLALMRPLSLASIFGGLSGTLSGAINVLSGLWASEPADVSTLAVGSAEALVPTLVAFVALTVAWLCATVGLGRQP
jgi:hypothetical protein